MEYSVTDVKGLANVLLFIEQAKQKFCKKKNEKIEHSGRFSYSNSCF